MFEKSLFTSALAGKVLLALLSVLLLLALCLVIIKFLQTKNLTARPKDDLKVLQTHPLAPKIHLTVVAWHETQYLLACSPDAVTVIDTKSPAAQIPCTKRQTV
jgi:flagellar biogenesis protein FliO